MASVNRQRAIDKGSYSGDSSAVTHSSGSNIEDTPTDDDAVPIGVVTQCSQGIENVHNGNQHQSSVWTRHSGHYIEIRGSMIAAMQQIQHDPHRTETPFVTMGPGEELDYARRPKEPPPILQHQLTTMQHLFPSKHCRVDIHISVLVPNGLPVPRVLLPTKERCFQLMIGTSLQRRQQQNEHNLFIQAEREEVCLFRQHNWCANTGG